MFTVLVAGSRTYNDYEEFVRIMDKVLENQTEVQLVSGGARGADSMAEAYAAARHIPIKVFPADWKQYGKSAGYRRNRQMHEFLAQFKNRGCILFWDGQSKGTQHNIGLADEFDTPLRIWRTDEKRMYRKVVK